MLISLHSQATTTPKIRAAIQVSDEPACAANDRNPPSSTDAALAKLEIMRRQRRRQGLRCRHLSAWQRRSAAAKETAKTHAFVTPAERTVFVPHILTRGFCPAAAVCDQRGESSFGAHFDQLIDGCIMLVQTMMQIAPPAIYPTPFVVAHAPCGLRARVDISAGDGECCNTGRLQQCFLPYSLPLQNEGEDARRCSARLSMSLDFYCAFLKLWRRLHPTSANRNNSSVPVVRASSSYG